MYEFLAPWGILIPLLSAIISYALVSEQRRKTLMKDIEAPSQDQERSFSAVQSPLSLMHG